MTIILKTVIVYKKKYIQVINYGEKGDFSNISEESLLDTSRGMMVGMTLETKDKIVVS